MEDGALKVTRIQWTAPRAKRTLGSGGGGCAEDVEMERTAPGLLAFLMDYLAVGIIFIAGAAGSRR